VTTKNPAAWELFNIDTDRSEQTDMVTTHVKVIERLEQGHRQISLSRA